jgi:hypothetical protein
MARTRRTITLDEKIEKAQQAVFQAKDKYDAAMEELNKLQKKKQELQKQELLKAIEASPLSYEEILKLLAGKSDSDEE